MKSASTWYAQRRWRRVRRRILVICSVCLGTGWLATRNGRKECDACQGTGNVDRWINEIVNEEE